ncbi:MAG: hypothetical protein M1829_002160 [Trizodia sp. TS-e1964]|nr:MAG: hypothetical protein M1829_002160 [Trizodia sp. TS-e1964]
MRVPKPLIGYIRRAISTASNPSDLLSIPPLKTRLRKYQEECIQSVLSSLQKGYKRLGVSLATGSGKTVIFTQLIDRIPPQTQSATQTLILVHRRELAEQASRHCIDAYPDKRVEIEMGDVHASGTADITIASIQSLLSADRIAKYDPNQFKLVIVDEAHHIVAPGYMQALDHFNLLSPTEKTPALVGVSATLSRFDGLKLGKVIDYVVYHKDYVDMIGEKWLSDVIFTTVHSKADISKVRKGAHGDFQPGSLSKAINTKKINEVTVRAWLSRAIKRKSTLVFCADIAHVSDLTAHFREYGIDARPVTSNTHRLARGELLDAFRKGEFQVLVNCGIFTEGTDIPNIDCVLLARPTKSRNLLVQMIGRGMRLYEGKINCHVIDMVASLEAGIITTPTLFGLDPSELVEGLDPQALLKKKEQKLSRTNNLHQDINHGPQPTEPCLEPPTQNITFTDYSSIFDLLEDSSDDRHIRSLSRLAWVNVDAEKFILSNNLGDFITLEKTKPNFYEIRFTQRLIDSSSGSPYMRPRQIASATSFVDAVHAADTYAKERFLRHATLLDLPWRQKPATEGQIALLNRLKGINDNHAIKLLTKGRAADLITKLKHGAKGRLKRMKVIRRREERQSEAKKQEESARRREQVTVGLLD